MARRFVRSWFGGGLEEVNDESPGGRQIIARDSTRVPRPVKHGGAYSQGWKMDALAVPVEQINEFNDAARRHGTGVTYVPTKDGSYAVPSGESRRSRNALLRMSGKIDFDGGYSDHTGS